MSFLDRVCVLILTRDEAANIARTLDALAAFPRVLVLDSGSADGTAAIAGGYANVRVAVRAFDAHAAQWNHGLDACDAEWVLALDADHVLEADLAAEIAALSPPAEVAGYTATFRYCVGGRALSGSLYPPRVVLFRRARGRYAQSGHTQRLALDGRARALAGRIRHDDRKPLARWLAAQQRYAALEAAHLLDAPRGSVGLSGRVRLLGWPAPVLAFAYALIAKRCLLAGWPGWVYVLQRTLAEILIALEILDRRGRRPARDGPGAGR